METSTQMKLVKIKEEVMPESEIEEATSSRKRKFVAIKQEASPEYDRENDCMFAEYNYELCLPQDDMEFDDEFEEKHVQDYESENEYMFTGSDYESYLPLAEKESDEEDDNVKREAKSEMGNQSTSAVYHYDMPEAESEEEEESETESEAVCTKVIPYPRYKLLYTPKNVRKLIIYANNSTRFREYNAISTFEFKCVKCQLKNVAVVELNGIDGISVKIVNKKHPCRTKNMIPDNFREFQIIQQPDYQLFQDCSGKYDKMLVIFDAEDESKCYEYAQLNVTSTSFYCIGCRSAPKDPTKVNPIANLCDFGTDKERVEIVVGEHRCRPRSFNPKKYEPKPENVLTKDFEIQTIFHKQQEKTKLIIFDEEDRSKCYQYFPNPANDVYRCWECSKNGQRVTAKLQRDSDGEEIVLLENFNHICEPLPYISNKMITLEHPYDFDLMEETKDGRPRIFLFDKTDKSKCYLFVQDSASKLYFCGECEFIRRQMSEQKISTTNGTVVGYVLKNEEYDSYLFRMKENQSHICKPKLYQPDLFQPPPKVYDFCVYSRANSTSVSLAIRHPQDNAYYYTFNFRKSVLLFYCNRCILAQPQVCVKALMDADGNYYFNHDPNVHNCQPARVSFFAEPNFTILNDFDLSLLAKPKPKFYESRIVKLPNFKLLPNKKGIPDKRVIIRHPGAKTLCYEYFWWRNSQSYQCKSCQLLKKTVNVRFYDDAVHGKYLVLGKNPHVCEPLNYHSLIKLSSKS